jgi:hypothetical protein
MSVLRLLAPGWLALLAVTLIASACGDAAGPPPPDIDPLSIHVPGDTIAPGGVMRVVVRGGVVTQENVSGTIGGVAFAMARANDTTLMALAPEVAPGPKPLALVIGPNTYETTVTVRELPPIPDPMAVINAAVEQAEATMSDDPPPGISAADWELEKEAMTRLTQDAAALASASPADQMAAARLLQAVEAELGPLAAVGALGFQASSSNAQCYARAGIAFVSILAYYASIGIIVAAAVVPGVNVLVIIPGIALLKQTLPAVSTDVAAMMAACSKQEFVGLTPFGGAVGTGLAGRMGDEIQASGGFTFEEGQPLRFQVVETVRPFNASDVSDPEIGKVASTVDLIYGAIASLPQWARSYFPALPPRPSTVPAKPGVTQAATPGDVTIENVTNGVTLSASADGSLLSLTASSESNVEVNFSFDVVSTTDPSVRETISATFIPGPRTFSGEFEFGVLQQASACAWPGVYSGQITIRVTRQGGKPYVEASANGTRTYQDTVSTDEDVTCGPGGSRGLGVSMSGEFNGTSFSLTTDQSPGITSISGTVTPTGGVTGSLGVNWANETNSESGGGSYVAAKSGSQGMTRPLSDRPAAPNPSEPRIQGSADRPVLQ